MTKRRWRCPEVKRLTQGKESVLVGGQKPEGVEDLPFHTLQYTSAHLSV